MSDYTSQISASTTTEEIDVWANEELESMDLDTTEEIEEALEEVEESFEEEISKAKETLTELEMTLSGDLSDEALARGEELKEELESLIENLEEAEEALNHKIEDRQSEIYDGTHGGQVNVTYSDESFSTEESSPIIINVDSSANYLASLENEEEESEYGTDGVKNYEDLYTTNTDDLVNKQIIALDYSALDNATTSVVSFDENTGTLVLKTSLEDGSYRLTEINGFNPDTMVLAVNGSFINESNQSHWSDHVPDSLTQSIYVNGSDYNLYDTLNVVGASLDERLQATGFADVVDEANISSAWSSYSNLITSGLTQDEFSELLNEVGSILYQMIDDPTKLGDPTLYNEVITALSASGLSATEIADALSLILLQMMKYDVTSTTSLVAGDFLNQVINLLSTSVDASGYPTQLATATSMILDEKLAMGSFGLSGGEHLMGTYTQTEISEDGSTSEIVDYEALLLTLDNVQSVYSIMGYGSNSSITNLITEVETIKTEAEKPVPGTSSEYESAYDEFKNYYDDAKNSSYGDPGVREGEWDTFLSRLLNSLFDENGNLVDDIWSTLEGAASKEGSIEGEDKDDLLANFICWVKNSGMSQEFQDAIFSDIAKKCLQFFDEDSDGTFEKEAKNQSEAEAILRNYL